MSPSSASSPSSSGGTIGIQCEGHGSRSLVGACMKMSSGQPSFRAHKDGNSDMIFEPDETFYV